MQKRILVTGGSGFVGSNLCSELVKDGNNYVIALDNYYTSNESNIANLLALSNFEFIEHDVIEAIDLDGIDEIYHLASPASPKQYQKDPVFTFRTNIWGSYNMLNLALKNKARILLASTSEVYGDPLVHPQVESYWGNVNTIGIRSNYDEGKRGAETLFMDFYRQYGVDIKIIRIFNTYGPKMEKDDGRVVSNFINQALNNEDITIYGDGSQTRSFQYVSDLVNGMIRMMGSENFTGPVNLGNPIERSIKDFAQEVLKLIPDSSSKIVFKDLPKDDPKVRKPDNSLAKEKLGWEPGVSLEDGLKKTIEYFISIQ
ncbi:SDR family oxidoreductase [bacterium]|nr:SDR family oxidoreductase [Candidatus Elulimicrobium humile]